MASFDFTVLNPSSNPRLALKKATWLDIPFIFELMLEGSLTGAFSDRYLFGAGHLKLVIWIAGAFIRRLRRTTERSSSQMFVIREGLQDVGFLQLEHSTSLANTPLATITVFAIAKKHQNQQLATQVLATVIDDAPSNTELVAYCTKYARAMQHVLRKLRFKRDKAMIENLARFSYHKNELQAHAEPEIKSVTDKSNSPNQP